MRIPGTLATLVLAGAATACFSDRPGTEPEPPASNGNTVDIVDFAYVPPNLSVPAGTVITWTNEDNQPHTVSADDGDSFESGIFDEGETYQLTAPAPGTYPYHCAVHPFMTATLTVTAP